MVAEEKSFWVIYDICTRLEYYQDLHNILAMPQDSVIRYNYHKEFIDEPSLGFTNVADYPKTVLLVYGEFNGYEKGAGDSKFEDLKKEKANFWTIPTRFAELLNIQKVDEEVYFDLILKGYPYCKGQKYVDTIIDSLDGFHPAEKNKFVSNCGKLNELNYLRDSGDNRSNWASIVKLLQKKSQFKDDSFWSLEGPFLSKGNRIKSNITYEITDKNKKTSFQNYYKINTGKEFYFTLYNYEPQKSISEIIKNSALEDNDINDLLRFIKIDDSNSPINSFLKKIELRQYFVNRVKFQRNYSSDLFSKEGACYFNTNGSVKGWAAGPNFHIYFKLSRNYTWIILGIIAAVVGVVYATKTGHYIKSDLCKAIISSIISTISFIIASFLIGKEIKTKI